MGYCDLVNYQTCLFYWYVDVVYMTLINTVKNMHALMHTTTHVQRVCNTRTYAGGAHNVPSLRTNPDHAVSGIVKLKQLIYNVFDNFKMFIRLHGCSCAPLLRGTLLYAWTPCLRWQHHQAYAQHSDAVVNKHQNNSTLIW
jgi:hypothetical protein